MKLPALLLIALALFAVPNAPPEQRPSFPSPPPPMNSDSTTTTGQPAPLSVHVDMAAMQKEANDLARTAQSIPDDVASLRKGILPKDFTQKLKQIEKLSKRLRSQVSD